jgi:transcriptional regulator with XRE-family HTH domain
MTVRQASAGPRGQSTKQAAAAHAGAFPGDVGPALTYAGTIRRAMQASQVSAADLASATGYSYEQLRRILKGEPIVSEQLNSLLCAKLGLEPAVTWTIALQEKAIRRLAPESAEVTVREEQRHLLAAFARLNDAERRRVLKLLHRLEHEKELRAKTDADH